MADPEDGVRVVWRIGDTLVPPAPGSVVEACSRCLAPVWFCAAQLIPPHLAGLPLVCVPCGLADDQLRPGIERMWDDTYNAARWSGQL